MHLRFAGAGLLAVAALFAIALPAQAGPSGVRGRIEGSDPVLVTVYAYPGHRERPTGPGFVAAAVPGPDGAFQLDLEPGLYTVAARSRASGQRTGGLTPGDRVASIRTEVPPEGYSDLGTLSLRPVDLGILGTMSSGTPATGTSISGEVTDVAGIPAAGLRVLAFTDPNMGGKPAAVSAPTGPDGRFELHLPAGGTYFLVARSHVGDRPAPGQRAGAFAGEEGQGLPVAEGADVRGIRIQVGEVLPGP